MRTARNNSNLAPLTCLGSEIYKSVETGNWSNTREEGARIAGGWTGAWAFGKAGIATGALAGSVFGPVGTAAGAVVGGVVGGIGGYWAGSKAGKNIYSLFGR